MKVNVKIIGGRFSIPVLIRQSMQMDADGMVELEYKEEEEEVVVRKIPKNKGE